MQQSTRLEDYLTRRSSPNGRGLRPTSKAAARAAADEFLRGGKSNGNRAHYRMCLMGAGIIESQATEIADSEL